MAVKTNITINIVEPGSDVPVPDTGLFTHGIGGTEATIILSVVLVLAIASIVLATYMYRKHKKAGKTTKLVRIVEQTKTIIKSKKRTTAGLAAISLLVSACTFTAFMLNSNKSNINAIEGEESAENNSDLTINTSDTDFTIEVGDEPVFAVMPVEVTVEEATQAGYTLTAYADSTNLVSTTNPNNKIPMVAVEGDELVALKDNTYGLALDNKPTSKDEEVYTALSTDPSTPTLIVNKDHEATEENDTTTIYYGFYITPDIPYGTYTSGEVEYEAEENKVATVTFDGNGLYFNDNKSQSANIVKYIAGKRDKTVYSHTPNVNDEGASDGNVAYNTIMNEVKTIEGAHKLHIMLKYGTYDNIWDYATFWQGSHPEYTAKNDYDKGMQKCGNTSTDGRFAGNYNDPVVTSCNISGDTVTFGFWSQPAGGPPLGYGYYAAITSYTSNNIISGNYLIPSSTTAHKFLGWSTEPNATVPMYYDDDSDWIDLSEGDITLYAIWQPFFSITYNGNGTNSNINMDRVEQYTTDLTSAEKQVDLLAPNFAKEGHGFVGWSTDVEAWYHLTDEDKSNNPIIYGPNQTIIVDPTVSTKIMLYAVWAPVETMANGTPVVLQNWQGCSSLAAATYDSATSTLNVSKNTITALADSRDGKIYTIARLADGNCWMTENLRLDSEPELSNTNTHAPSLPLTNNYAEQATSNNLSVSSNNWCSDNNDPACYDQSMLNTNNVALTTVSPVFSQDFTSLAHKKFRDNIYSYGNYYNWYSATAGNGTYDVHERGTDIIGDICPAGWQLPVGDNKNSSGSFYYLNQQMGKGESSSDSNNWRSFPNNFVYSGDWNGSSSYNELGDQGNYWSRTVDETNGGYYLKVDKDYVNPVGTANKYYGFSIRCMIPAAQ